MIPQARHTKPEAVPRSSKPTGSSHTHLISWALLLGVAVLGLLFVFSDARLLWQTASTLDVRLLALPFAFGLASYVIMARSYQGIAQAAGSEVPFWEMLKITFVANTVNYVVSTGGLSGFAVRLYFFIRLKIPSGRAVTISLVQTFITNVILLLFVVVGFAYLLMAHNLQGYALAT